MLKYRYKNKARHLNVNTINKKTFFIFSEFKIMFDIFFNFQNAKLAEKLGILKVFYRKYMVDIEIVKNEIKKFKSILTG